MTLRESNNTQKWTANIPRPALQIRSWDITEGVNTIGGKLVYWAALSIQGDIYAQVEADTLETAYLKLLNEVAPALTRGVTIARLVGGEL